MSQQGQTVQSGPLSKLNVLPEIQVTTNWFPNLRSVKSLDDSNNLLISQVWVPSKTLLEMPVVGRWEGGSGWGTHVNPWLFHFNVWQNPLQYKKFKKIFKKNVKQQQQKKEMPVVLIYSQYDTKKECLKLDLTLFLQISSVNQIFLKISLLYHQRRSSNFKSISTGRYIN